MKVRGYEAYQPATGEEQKRCARGERCAAGIPVRQGDGTIRIEGAFVYRAFCDADRGLVSACVEQMYGYHKDLGDELGEKGRGHGEKVTRTRTADPPVNLTYEALRGDIVDLVASWAGRVALVAGLHGRDAERTSRAYGGEPLRRMCESLAAHLDALLALEPEPMTRFMRNEDADELPEGTPVRRNYDTGIAAVLLDLDGGDAGLEFIRLNNQCRWMLGLTGADEEIPVPCWNPECELRGTVFRPDGAAGLADYAVCKACGEKYEADRFLRLMAEVYEQEIARNQARKKAS